VVALACIPISIGLGFLFPTSSPTFVVGGVFDDSYSNRDEVESQGGFDLFPYILSQFIHCWCIEKQMIF
jgi:hypothetical protein